MIQPLCDCGRKTSTCPDAPVSDVEPLDTDLTFDPALGLNLRFGWKALSATYTLMSYKAESGGTFNAGAIGFSGHLPF